MKVLVVEDDLEVAAFIAESLRQAGHEVTLGADGDQGIKLAAVEFHDVIVVDRMLPQVDGLALVQCLRRIGLETPILFLTALGGIDDRVQGLDAGGDDYLVKPFDRLELVARVNALGRRKGHRHENAVLRAGPVLINRLTRQVRCAGHLVEVLPREFRLLEVLVEHKNQVVTKNMLLEQVWELHFDPKTSIVETHLSRLRAKLEPYLDVPLIRNVRGAGYCIDDPT